MSLRYEIKRLFNDETLDGCVCVVSGKALPDNMTARACLMEVEEDRLRPAPGEDPDWKFCELDVWQFLERFGDDPFEFRRYKFKSQTYSYPTCKAWCKRETKGKCMSLPDEVFGTQ